MEAKLQAHPGDICGAPGFLDVFDVTCVFAQYKNLSKLILRYFSDSKGLVAKESTEPCCHHCHFQARVKIANEGVNGWITGPLGADVATWEVSNGFRVWGPHYHAFQRFSGFSVREVDHRKLLWI